MSDPRQDKENSSVTKSPNSPNILKPKPICLRKKPKRLAYSQPLGSLDSNITFTAPSNLGYLRKSPVKCVNPFRCIEKRKRDIDAENTEDSFLHRRTKNCDILSSQIQEEKSFCFNPVVPSTVNEDAHMGYDNQHYFAISKDKDVVARPKEKRIPVDWSLKTKIRLTSAKPFPWRTSFKTSEEASGTTGFVRCLHPDSPKSCSLDSSHGAKFYQQCLVWMHPSIPWLSLFPRTSNHGAISSSPSPPMDVKQQDVLHSNWCDSFRSLYQLVRMCQCPFFYLCAPSFTVLFRAGGIGSILDIHAVITPTSRGFRNSLKAEGIEFTMPLYHGSELDGTCDLGLSDKSLSFNDESIAHEENDKLEQCEIGDEPAAADKLLAEDEEPGMWLESLGLSQQDFPMLNSKRAKLKKEQRQSADHRPESLVFVEGSETQALVNFLLNYPSCMSKIGPLAGVPPTLLSPVSFLGATLQSHKVRHGKVRDKENELHAVELSGPLLPNTIHSLCSLFSSTQEGNFSAALTTYQPTSAFTRLSPQSATVPPAFATENLKDCGLPASFIQHMCTKNLPVGVNGITTITAENMLFTWA